MRPGKIEPRMAMPDNGCCGAGGEGRLRRGYRIKDTGYGEGGRKANVEGKRSGCGGWDARSALECVYLQVPLWGGGGREVITIRMKCWEAEGKRQLRGTRCAQSKGASRRLEAACFAGESNYGTGKIRTRRKRVVPVGVSSMMVDWSKKVLVGVSVRES